MVMRRSVRWRQAAAGLLLGLGLSALAAPPQAPALSYELDRPSLALGEPLQLRLSRAADAAGPSLETLDLAPLQRDFEITERTLGRDSRQETLTLTLYARRTGRIDLPVPGRSGRAPRVTVSEGSDSVPRVQWKLGLDPAEPVLRQPVAFTLEACDDGTLLWQRPPLPAAEGLLLRPLGETEIITTRDGQRCTAHRWHWALLPTAAGAHTLPLPVLEAGKFGRRLRFASPALAFTTLPLPGWLPAEAAVGRPEIEAEPRPKQALLGQPLAWRLRVTGAYGAPALAQLLALQLHQADARLGLDTYPPQVEALAGPTPAPQHRITLFVVPRARGALELPALQLPWYDPQAGVLQQAWMEGGVIEVLDPVRQRWLRVGAVALGVGLSVLLAVLLWCRLGWRWRRHRLRRQLGRADSLAALGRLLRAFDPHGRATPAPTWRSWQARMERKLDSRGLEALVAALERECYGAADPAAEAPAARLQARLAQTRAWLDSIRPR